MPLEFLDLVKNRSSIRSYEDRPVEDEKIEYILECARLAPSWVNKQCWRFIVVKDKETISKIANTSVTNRWLKHTPMLIVACGDPIESGNRNNIEYYTVDVSIAMEHIVLAAADIGLGSCWIAGYDEKKVKEILEIPKRIRVVALTPIGYPAGDKTVGENVRKIVTGSKKRRSLGEIVHYEIW